MLGSSTYSEVTVGSSLTVIEKAQRARELAGEEGHKGHIDTWPAQHCWCSIFRVQLCSFDDSVITQPSVVNSESQRQGHTKCSKSKVLLLSYIMFYSTYKLRYWWCIASFSFRGPFLKPYWGTGPQGKAAFFDVFWSLMLRREWAQALLRRCARSRAELPQEPCIMRSRRSLPIWIIFRNKKKQEESRQ